MIICCRFFMCINIWNAHISPTFVMYITFILHLQEEMVMDDNKKNPEIQDNGRKGEKAVSSVDVKLFDPSMNTGMNINESSETQVNQETTDEP